MIINFKNLFCISIILLMLFSRIVNANSIPEFKYDLACSQEFFYEAELMDDVREIYPKKYFWSVSEVKKEKTKCHFYFEDVSNGEKKAGSYTYTYFELENKWNDYYKKK